MSNGPNPILEDETLRAERSALARALHELEASQGRVQVNAERLYDTTRRDLVVQLLPLVDNVTRLLVAAARDVPVASGLRMLRAQLDEILVAYGVERFDVDGERFDPAMHEAISTSPVRDPHLVGMVVQQLVAGYRMDGKLLRAAKVIIGTLAPLPRPGSAGRATPPRQ